MIAVSHFADHTVAVVGLGKSGLATAKALTLGGARVWAWDDGEKARDQAEECGIEIRRPDEMALKGTAAVVLSPGIPLTHPVPHPVVALARQAGCPVIGDIELLSRSQTEARFIGITGTNGKSTTTALLGHVLAAAGRRVETGGNLGMPALGLSPLGSDGVYVLELSSYQLDLLDEAIFDIAVLINIAPDHLDRHGGMDGYVAAKQRIFAGGDSGSVAVIGIDDPHSAAMMRELRRDSARRVVPVSASVPAVGGVYVTDGLLIDDLDGEAREITDLTAIATLPGRHNWQNAAAAYAAARAAGLAGEDIVAGLASYPGLAHRMERIALIDGILYVNDSKATNGDAAARAMVCYDNIYWIAGGLAKEGGLTDVEPFFGRVRRAFLIGDAMEAFAATLEGKVPAVRSETLATAVGQARAAALEDGANGAVVLLSPACASFDQFANFEARGEAFRGLVENLPGTRGEAA